MCYREAAKQRLRKAYFLLLRKPQFVVLDHWLSEAIQKEVALAFITSKELNVEYQKFKEDRE